MPGCRGVLLLRVLLFQLLLVLFPVLLFTLVVFFMPPSFPEYVLLLFQPIIQLLQSMLVLDPRLGWVILLLLGHLLQFQDFLLMLVFLYFQLLDLLFEPELLLGK